MYHMSLCMYIIVHLYIANNPWVLTVYSEFDWHRVKLPPGSRIKLWASRQDAVQLPQRYGMRFSTNPQHQ